MKAKIDRFIEFSNSACEADSEFEVAAIYAACEQLKEELESDERLSHECRELICNIMTYVREVLRIDGESADITIATDSILSLGMSLSTQFNILQNNRASNYSD
ncbi:hypothetical protein [Pseudoalteromonas galatheae]|uniref:hypothetical protein n=1 Tax=Pseudoalteromonas galatheae TaxID=579562 RepID=UPI0034C66BC4